VSAKMRARESSRKNQMIIGFVVAWGGSWFTVWAMIRPFGWLVDVRRVAVIFPRAPSEKRHDYFILNEPSAALSRCAM
jgi:hypothetical protein